ncbi:cysteine protease ATG4 [Thecamonas trahens ATCC 50062]|uniref:Cysteine protease n=1 Tax=Thecamonas trahens ATCC 50062 TaxID=461836 RepID=A0A0L0DDE1_THETB|nr:cysteine protease ATG4 [Thecamonas trahens ATCC 50062]KNC50344.1 cysteine protease ATG4 [Thecamonas trahens ATCC 50062]|eukprot:XP_013756890.1 cysteine protease ATG4 [Thecamonas trahens ATCC 50062]
MLRSGQMLLANVLVGHLLGPSWRLASPGQGRKASSRDTRLYRRILSWFADVDRPSAPYAIHHMAQLGALRHDISLGCWFGPHTTALVIAELVGLHTPRLAVYVASDSTLFRDRIRDASTPHRRPRYPFEEFDAEVADGVTIQTKRVRRVALPPDALDVRPLRSRPPLTRSAEPTRSRTVRVVPLDRSTLGLGAAWDVLGVPMVEPWDELPSRSSGTQAAASCSDNDAPSEAAGFLPLLILVPLRLGIDAVNPLYYPSLQALLAFPQSRGMMGGRPNSAFYFVASRASTRCTWIHT